MSKIKDVVFSDLFWDDWDNAPKDIQKRFSDDMNRVGLTGELIPSMKPHKIKGHPEGWWIGYVSIGVFAWRFLFSFSSSGALVVERLMSHNEMDKLLR